MKVTNKLNDLLLEGWLFIRYFLKQDDEILPESPRGLEWLTASIMIVTGVWGWNTGHLDQIVENPFLWAMSLLVIGFVRIIALIINGSWRRSPILRTIGALAGVTCWTYLAGRYFQIDPSSGLGMTYIVFVWAEFYSCMRSANDSVTAYLLPRSGPVQWKRS